MEPVLPPAESVVNQFNMRPTFLVTDGEEDDRLNAASWLSTTMGDDSDQEPDRVCLPLPRRQRICISAPYIVWCPAVIESNRKMVSDSRSANFSSSYAYSIRISAYQSNSVFFYNAYVRLYNFLQMVSK